MNNIIFSITSYFSPSRPSGFRMVRVSTGVYRVTYPRPGAYAFKYTATDNNGLTATASVSVTVHKGKLSVIFITPIL